MRYLIVPVFALLLGGCGDPCSEDNSRYVHKAVERFQQAVSLAEDSPRVMMGSAIQKMQDLRSEAEKDPAFMGCLTTGRSLLSYMLAEIEAMRSFYRQDPDSVLNIKKKSAIEGKIIAYSEAAEHFDSYLWCQLAFTLRNFGYPQVFRELALPALTCRREKP